MSDSDGRDLVGVGGWLLFFVIALAVFSPIRAVVEVASLSADPAIAEAYGDAWPTIEAAEWVLVAVSVVAVWFIAWRLVYVRNRRTVQIAIAGLWIVGVGVMFSEYLLIALLAGIPLSFVLEGMTPEIVRPFVFGTVWTLYFLRSRRVDNTYRGLGSEAAHVFR